jgi:hypothetical protein
MINFSSYYNSLWFCSSSSSTNWSLVSCSSSKRASSSFWKTLFCSEMIDVCLSSYPCSKSSFCRRRFRFSCRCFLSSMSCLIFSGKCSDWSRSTKRLPWWCWSLLRNLILSFLSKIEYFRKRRMPFCRMNNLQGTNSLIKKMKKTTTNLSLVSCSSYKRASSSFWNTLFCSKMIKLNFSKGSNTTKVIA